MKSIDNDDSCRNEPVTHPPYPMNCHPSLSPPSSSSCASPPPVPSSATSRFSLQTLTNMIQLPWSRSVQQQQERGRLASPVLKAVPSSGSRIVYVSKEAQLEKLKIRLLGERARSLTRNGVDVCRQCSEDGAVYL